MTAVSSLHNIESACTGPLRVTNILVPQDSLGTARTEAPATARSAQAAQRKWKAPHVPTLDLSQVTPQGGKGTRSPRNKITHQALSKTTAAPARRDATNCISQESALRLPEGAQLIDVVVDLSRPFGVLFNNDLSVRAVKEKSQGEKLNIHVGYIIVSASGLMLKSISSLEAHVSYLRSQGRKSISVQFAKPKSMVASPVGELPASQGNGEKDLDHLSREDFKAMQQSPEVQTIDDAVETPTQTPRNAPDGSLINSPAFPQVECTLDMSLPWGLLIGDDMYVQSVQEDSQAEAAGIGHGWKMLAVEGQLVSSMHLMKEKLSALKSGGRFVRLTFEPCDDDDTSEEEGNADSAGS